MLVAVMMLGTLPYGGHCLLPPKSPLRLPIGGHCLLPPSSPIHPPVPLPCLPRRKLEVAVREENYSVAAEAKREIELLTERLPANQLLLATLLERLDKGGLPEEEATAVVRQLGELGEW